GGELRDIDGALNRAAHDLRLGHGFGEPADAAARPQLAAKRARALGEDADARAVAQLLDRARQRAGVPGAAVDRDLAHAVEHLSEPGLPQRGLRERAD